MFPTTEVELVQSVRHHQMWPSLVEDHRAIGKTVELGMPGQPVAGPLQTASGAQSLGCQHPIQSLGSRWLLETQTPGDSRSIPLVVGSPAKSAGTVSGGQGDGIVEEEEGRPMARLVKGCLPVLVSKSADDPQISSVVTGQVPVHVDEASPIPGEQTPFGTGMEIPEWVDPIAAGLGEAHVLE